MAYAVVLKGILMELEHDKYGNAYEVEMLKNLHKVCPLTGYRAEHFDCDYKDCSKITPDKYDLLYNQRYHCEVERRNIQLEFERRLQRYMDSIRADERRSKSLEVAKTINVNQFYEFCDDLEQYMKQNRQAYTQNLIIYPYHEQDTIFLVFWYDKDTLVDFSVTDNISSHMSTHFAKMREDLNYTLSYRLIPKYLSEAVRIYFCLKYDVDTKNILKDGNPVYLRENGLKKYLLSAYGTTLINYKLLRIHNPSITEILNYDSIILIKQEIDETVKEILKTKS